MAYRTEALLEREEQLDDYLAQLARGHIRVLTRLSPGYPRRLAKQLGLPLIEEKCLAWMECRLLPATAAQTQYDTLFGEVVSAAADERAFVTGRWQFDDDKLNTLHHLGTGNFVASGRHVRANSLDE